MSESIKLIHHRVNQKHPDDIHARNDADADTGVTTIALPLLCTYNGYSVMYKTIFVINIIIHMCLQHSNTL